MTDESPGLYLSADVRSRVLDLLIAAGYPPESARILARIIIEADDDIGGWPRLASYIGKQRFPKLRGVNMAKAAIAFVNTTTARKSAS